jgi:uncharacterized protein with HEPN domain
MKRDEATILDIADAIAHIQSFLNGVTQARFYEDPKTQSAILYQLLVIGEAVKRLSAEFRIQNSMIPWALMAGMRDHLIHAYDSVDWEEVWKTVTDDIPVLKVQIQSLMKTDSDQ